MTPEDVVKTITELHSKLNRLPDLDSETEKKAEEYLSPLFEALGWDWLSAEVKPQKRVRSAGRTKRVDYAFRKTGRLRSDFYLEVKNFSESVDDSKHVRQALEYGKNSGTRWVVLTNFTDWRVFNSDFFADPNGAELFTGFKLLDAATDREKLGWLTLLSREQGGPALDEFAKKHKKWKESESVEDLLTEQLIVTRKALSSAIREHNWDLFNPEPADEDRSVDFCVQHILDRLIFCRMLEDSGIGDGLRMEQVYEEWREDKRVQFYREYLCNLWTKMRNRYDSSIFDNHRIDGLSIKNEDFTPIFESFYVNPKTKLRYRFEAIPTDVLGHAYENYLSYKLKQTEKRTGLEKELYKRKQGGIYYTPEFLVDHLVGATVGEKLKACKTPADALKLRVLDPACGSGTFLVRAFEEFKQWHLEHVKKNGNGEQTELDAGHELGRTTFLDRVLENCIYGIDIDLHAVGLTKLNLFLRAIDTPNQLPKLKVLHANSLVWDDDLPLHFKMDRDFPLVHERGGFDVVLGNPPWEKWKPDSQEFFEEFHPGFKSLPKQEAKKVMEDLLKTRRGVKKRWEDNLRDYETYSDVYRTEYQFQSNGGDLDLYKVFIERAYQLLKPGGNAGLVVPSGIYTDLGTKGLRGMLFDQCQLMGMYSFENRYPTIFEDVDSRFKPVLLTFTKGGNTKSFKCAFFLHGEDDLRKALETPTTLTVDFVKRSSPTSWGVLEIKSPRDKDIVEKLLKYPPLGEERGDTWNANMSRGFDMTNASHLFREGRLDGVPMLEGKNIEQFTHRWKEAPTPRYSIDEKDILSNLKPEAVYHTGYWMAYRLIASSTNYRTFISTIVPPGYTCGNSIAIVRLPALKPLCYLCGVINSFVVDYFIRQKVSANVNMFYFLETPVPRITSGELFDEIVKKTAQLVATTPEFDLLKKETGVSHGLTNESDRLLARAQLDVAVAKLYGISKVDLAYILTKFPNVDQKQKDAVLREYL